MNVIIIEDEPLNAEYLTRLLSRIDTSIKVIATFDTVKKSVEELPKMKGIDLLFVDIHLADGISFEIFSLIEIDYPIIFTTAFDQYALKAFKLNSIDYLLKPIGVTELTSAIEKYKNYHVYKPEDFSEITKTYLQTKQTYKSRFLIKIGDHILPVTTNEIIHFIAKEGTVYLVNDSKKEYPIDYSLENLESILQPELFFRINRKVIIHLDSIQKVSAYFNSRLIVQSSVLDSESAIVSRDRVNDFKKWLEGLSN